MDADSVSPAMNKEDAQQVTDLLRPVSSPPHTHPAPKRSPWDAMTRCARQISRHTSVTAIQRLWLYNVCNGYSCIISWNTAGLSTLCLLLL